MATRKRRRNPMPMGSALYLSNPKRRRNGRKRSSGAFGRVIAKLNRNGRKRRNGRRTRRNSVALKVNRRRRNSVALKVNRKRNGRRTRRNSVALRLNSRKRRNSSRRHRKGGSRRRTNRNPYLKINRKRRNGRKTRRNSVALRMNGKRRRNGRGRRTNRNPYLKINRRRNGARRRRNSGSAAGGVSLPIFSQLAGIVRKVPVVGKHVAPYIVPAGLGLAALGGTYLIVKYVVPFAPAAIQEYLAPIGYTVSGAAFGLLVSKLPIPFVGAGAKKAIAAAAPMIGVGVDLYRYLSGSTALGDGGYWQLGALGGDDGGSDPDNQGVQSEYADASMVDSMYAGDDLDQLEGEAAVAGPRAWLRRFAPVRRMTRVTGGASRHAQQHGHRWGWLIRLVGFQKFRAIAALPPAQRHQYIQALKQYAKSSIPGQIGEAQAQQAVAGAEYAGVLYAGNNY